MRLLDRPSRPPAAGRLTFGLYALHLWTVFGLALSNGFLALAALASPWSVEWRRVPWKRLAPTLLPLGLYCVLLALSVAGSYQPARSLRAFGELSSLAALFFALVAVRGERDVRRVVDGLVAVAGILALIGLAQLLAGFGGLDQRIRGPFSHYMTFAGVLVIADMLLLASLACGRGLGSWWRWVALLAINLALMLSLTRSAWVAVLASLTLLALIRAPRSLLAFVPVGLIALVLAPVPVVHRGLSVFDLQDISNYDRVCMVEAGMHMVAERPILGQGPDMVALRYPIYRHPTAPRLGVPHLHNNLVHLAAERGLLALVAYLWLMGGAIWTAWRGLRDPAARAGGRADLHAGALVALVAFNLAGLFEYNWGDSEVQRIALFVVAIPACLRAWRDDAPAPGRHP